MKRNHYLLTMEDWTEEELNAEVNGYEQLGGVGVKDTIRLHKAKDELQWRIDKGYGGLTPKEIKEEIKNESKEKKHNKNNIKTNN